MKLRKIPKDVICDGIYIGRENVSGFTKKEALEKLKEREEAYRNHTVTFCTKKKKVEVSFEELGFYVKNGEKLAEQAVNYGKEGGVYHRYFQIRKLKRQNQVFQPEYCLKDAQANKVMEDRVSKLLAGASNATISRTNGKFVITKEKEGMELDISSTLKEFHAFLNDKWNGKSCEFQVIEKVQKPTITKKQLSVIQDRLGRFTTYCGSGQSRVTNIEVATKKIDGTILMPGEEFSAGKRMRPFTKEEGYVEAGSYANGEVVADIAGGICQVSTTLYNAVINAELEVLSRQSHSMLVHYVKPSRDAAIAGDYKDMKFRNNLKHPIYIQGFVEGGYVYFNIYGKDTRPEGREVEFISETLSTTDVVKQYVVDPEINLGRIVNPGGGQRGVQAQLWKVVTQDGKEISREVFNKSTYKPSTRKIKVGIKSDNRDAVGIVKAAVRTQDEAKIREAIGKAAEQMKGQQE